MMAITTILMIALFSSCGIDPTPNSPNNLDFAILSIEFDNIAGEENLHLNTGSYTTATGDTFSVSSLQYYISNIIVKRLDGYIHIVPPDSSYFLIKEGEPTSRHAKIRVPTGVYTGLTFILGVDSLRSCMDLSRRKGVLDPSGSMDEGMYWGWNSGYIFFRMEGSSPQAPVDPSGERKFRYHIGGFGGYSAPTINNLKTITLDLYPAGPPNVKVGREANVHVMVDITKVFSGNTNISIAAHPSIMFSKNSVQVANNLQGIFRHDHTEN